MTIFRKFFVRFLAPVLAGAVFLLWVHHEDATQWKDFVQSALWSTISYLGCWVTVSLCSLQGLVNRLWLKGLNSRFERNLVISLFVFQYLFFSHMMAEVMMGNIGRINFVIGVFTFGFLQAELFLFITAIGYYPKRRKSRIYY